MQSYAVLFIAYFALYAHADDVDFEKTILTTVDFPPEVYLKQTGDWFSLEYGKGDQLLRKELVDLTDAVDSNNPHYTVVGVLNIHNDTHSNMYSYSGDENGIKILGVRESTDIIEVDPIKYAQDFGWIRPANTFVYY